MTFDATASKNFTTVPELALEWRVSVPHIHNLINRKQLPAHKIGARYIVNLADAQKFLAQHATAKVAA